MLACALLAAPAPARDAGTARTSDSIDDLPAVDVPPTSISRRDDPHADSVVVLLTGDGGWAGLDREVAAQFGAHGVPVIALSSLKYFWHARTPDQTALDVARLARYALGAYRRTRVILVGYSFGADVLPFVVNRLPVDVLDRTASLHLLALSTRADFEIHPADWLRRSPSDDGMPVVPEITRLPPDLPRQCYYGQGEQEDPCPKLPATAIGRVVVGSGHDFSGDARSLVAAILRLRGGLADAR